MIHWLDKNLRKFGYSPVKDSYIPVLNQKADNTHMYFIYQTDAEVSYLLKYEQLNKQKQ